MYSAIQPDDTPLLVTPTTQSLLPPSTPNTHLGVDRSTRSSAFPIALYSALHAPFLFWPPLSARSQATRSHWLGRFATHEWRSWAHEFVGESQSVLIVWYPPVGSIFTRTRTAREWSMSHAIYGALVSARTAVQG